ncbi:similar to Saccharomyces cerevisiae YPL069C BTS1 Geranylgeranyl diphosphate synthase [Maudiozyma barnettii]|uniref:Similar to Saccharomyces cerevisiae YPL069C BTS1 Geranylgeranyl diphosphate synthase n=1 Tax=Maudiozyma barnettii TaxID=61262 RepID=A0A8H2ZIS3_9SACH|nr:farnesyltranstransferase [Kazachstania barnettii]CAB4255812.1 similar to Saccharomyces cerevisiae YPL069C BTS1 Geranylgeranyl diphosphate synthase [Kazachstania barnettii]CAD1784373.1 similar to Saccharomyces cerevisiae YPL069C BTS1 Geranylgeranyl diphosphate synthase [Kazachstania barnettii]
MNKETLKDLLTTPRQWTESDEHILRKPYLHIAEQEGKKFRSKLIETFAIFYNMPKPDIHILQKIIEILHTASLMIDDIEDNSLMRRGVKTSHLVYGIPMTLNSANYMYFVAMSHVKELGNAFSSNNLDDERHHTQIELMDIFQDELINLHRGQGLELYWRDTNTIPTIDMYFDMVANKTGGLFRLAIRMMEFLAKRYENSEGNEDQKFNIISNSLVPLCNMLGVIYQIRDDYLNLVDDTMQQKKGFAEDITEGKLSFPIIHALEQESNMISKDSTHKPFLKNTIFSRTDNIEEKKVFIKILQDETKSLTYTSDTLKNIMSLLNEGDYYPIPVVDNNILDRTKIDTLKAMVEKLAAI